MTNHPPKEKRRNLPEEELGSASNECINEEEEEGFVCLIHIHGKDEEGMPRFHSFEEYHLVKDPLCEPHHLGGSLKEGEEKLRESKELFINSNSLVSNCCWRYQGEDWGKQYFLGEFETLR